jgi:hypothetical protein
MIQIDELVSIEKQLWTNDPVVYGATLTPEAALVFAETGMISREQAVEAIKQENAGGRRWAEVAFAEVRVSRLVDDAILLHYRVTARWEHDVDPVVALASSVYVRRDETWKLAFHQQTEIHER